MGRRALLLGAALGFTLSSVGFTDFGELHRMLTLTDWRLFYVFGGAVALSWWGFRRLSRSCPLPSRRLHTGTLIGSVLFGVGWAVTGACPAAPLAQLGEGKLPALFTLAGVLAGTWAYEWLHRRHLRWDRGSCGD